MLRPEPNERYGEDGALAEGQDPFVVPVVSVDLRFTKGLALFAQGEYFECHEVIEALWLETPGEDRYRDLYKGVIQAAAAIYQLERGILSGARGLYRTSVQYLQPYRPRALGCDVEALLTELNKRFNDEHPGILGKSA